MQTMSDRPPVLLAVFAHPDDESFRCGGTLALLAQRGIHVQIITATRGEAGSCGEPPLCRIEKLAAVREQELRCACTALGIAPPIFLDYFDGKLAEVNEKKAVAQIIKEIQNLRPQVLLTWPSDGLSGHPDHVAVSKWTTAAYLQVKNEGIDELAALYHLAMPDSLAMELGMKQMHTIQDNEITVTVNIQSVWEQKIAAITCHRTQAGESPILHEPIERQLRFLGWEHFYRARFCKTEDMLLKFNHHSKDQKKNEECDRNK
jgi:LmbE family N-acetylglucosaminyl deacetylase